MAFAFALFACTQTPPKSVTDNFTKKFTGATKVKWEKEEENEWKAEFKMNGNKMSACFNNAGEWLETVKEISKKDLPAIDTNAINAKFAKAKIKAASEIETPDFKGYEIAIENDKIDMEDLVPTDGKLTVKKNSEEEEEEDEK